MNDITDAPPGDTLIPKHWKRVCLASADIYQDQGDHKLWLATLAQACEKTRRRIHARVMMSNHYYLLLETPEPILVEGMKFSGHLHPAMYELTHG